MEKVRWSWSAKHNGKSENTGLVPIQQYFLVTDWTHCLSVWETFAKASNQDEESLSNMLLFAVVFCTSGPLYERIHEKILHLVQKITLEIEFNTKLYGHYDI